MAAFLDNCRFIPTAGGTTDFTYASAVGGCQSPSAAGAVNGVKYKLRAESAELTQWEIFEGAYNASTGTFPRTTVLYNSSATGTASGQSGAGTKINFSTVPQVAVIGIAEDLISIEVANSFSATQRAQARSNISAVLRGHIFGLTLSTAGASATFSVAIGEAADSTAVDLLSLATSYSKTTTAWAVGSGNGALDTGTIAASTWYHVYLIRRPDTGVVDVLISLSAAAPTLPANYTLFRRIGSMLTNSSSQWVLFSQNGDEFLWAAPSQDFNTTTLSTSAILIALSVPSAVKVNALIRGLMTNSTAGIILLINSPDETAVAADTPTGNRTAQNPVAGGGSGAEFSINIRTNISSQIRVVSNTSGTTLIVVTAGWIDTRGKLS